MHSTSPHPLMHMPVASLQVQCVLREPWEVVENVGVSATTTMRGLLGDVLQADSECAEVASWLRPTPSRWHPDQIVPRLMISVGRVSEREWAAQMLVRGSSSMRELELLLRSLFQCARQGVLQNGRVTTFDVRPGAWHQQDTAAALRQRVQAIAACSTIGVQFATPCSARTIECSELAGNLAAALSKLYRTVEGPDTWDKRAIDDEADAARSLAVAAFKNVSIVGCQLEARERGVRRSGSTGHAIPLDARRGFVVLEGDLTDAAPWLALMELHGVGTHTSFGLGRVALWLPLSDGSSPTAGDRGAIEEPPPRGTPPARRR